MWRNSSGWTLNRSTARVYSADSAIKLVVQLRRNYGSAQVVPI
jgi:hypothetical protein